MRDRRHPGGEIDKEHRRYDRRAFPRSPARFEVRYGKGNDLKDGVGFEIGTGGVSFAADTTLTLESELDIHYRLGPDDPWVKVRAVVKHSEGDKQGTEFLNLRMSDRLRIVDFVADKK